MTWALADSYRAELVRAARKGLAFAPGTGEPESWAAPGPEPVTWYRHAVAYAEMKWPHLAPHSRASLAGALATVTPLLAREAGRRPPAQTLRAALYGHAFNARRRSGVLSLWLNASGAPAEVAARAGNSARVLHEVYLHCTDGQDDTVSQQIEDALDAGTGITHSPPGGKASGYTHRRHRPRPCPLYVREPVPGPAHSPRPSGPADLQHRMQTLVVTSVFADQAACEAISAEAGRCPDLAHA